jgi:hypothetical protein
MPRSAQDILPDVRLNRIGSENEDGAVAGKAIKLAVRHQRVYDFAERDLWAASGISPRPII